MDIKNADTVEIRGVSNRWIEKIRVHFDTTKMTTTADPEEAAFTVEVCGLNGKTLSTNHFKVK